MAKLEPISHSDLVKRLTIPNPHRQSIGEDLPTRILRQAGIARRDWTQKRV